MKRVWMIVCLAAALGGCLLGTDPPAPLARLDDSAAGQGQAVIVSQPVQPPAPALAAEQDMHCDVEADCLAKLGDVANRSGRTLRLKLDDGSTKSFTSTADCNTVGATCVQTSLADYRPSQHLFVVAASYYETSASIIVSRRTGAVFRIENEVPHFSPDGQRFVLATLDEMNGINQVEIYRSSAFPPVLEWSHTPASFNTGYEFAGWTGNDQIRLRTLPEHAAAGISRTSAGWRLAPAK